MQKILSLSGACLLILLFNFSGAAAKSYQVVASTFPVYLFTANICANAPNVEARLLVPAQAGCPHDFALRPKDLRLLASADALVINGAGLEDFLEKPLAGLERKPAIIDASENVPVLEEHGHPNSHIFGAPAQARQMAANIAAALARLDPQNARIYEENARLYCGQLEELSQRLAAIGKKAKNNKIAIEHDALAYLAANANLEIAAMLEHGASASQLGALEKTIAREKPAALAGDSQYSDRLLKTLAKDTGLPYILLNPCASGPENAPLDYYQKVMRENLQILEGAFEN